ncbi:hypothetical protein DPMN_193555 [Dreissena polymorpha]|uniref:Uncharacterized protein n=1 Tax=Dreissena polymorpha TaxID=45954 RepID=A0A9D3XZX4_DREPO|nr:hypothetical protein DPMN_193555 [Dreissena polymorpha]
MAPLTEGSLINAKARDGKLRRHEPEGPEQGADLNESIFLDVEIDGKLPSD